MSRKDGTGVATRHALRFPGTLAGFKDAARALGDILDGRPLESDLRYDVELVFDELAANIVRHAHPTDEVEMEITFDGEITMTFEDDGVAFDPRLQPAPPAPATIAEARVGGLGLVLVRKICSRIDYVRTPQGRNRLAVAIPIP